MKNALIKFKDSGFSKFWERHQKYAPIIFFIAGFIFDSLTLGRVDRLYDLIMLCLYMTSLTIVLYLYNVVDDGKWKNTRLGRYEEYLPLAIQFFFGGLSSAYVIYFSRSVSLSKTMSFFIILIILFFANEYLKKRISNKYLQFSVYFFISFTFFVFIIPVFIKEMNTEVFIFSGAVSLICTLVLIVFIYIVSPSTRSEVHLGRLIGIILSIYSTVNVFYFFNLIPPVPLAMETGIVAHNIEIRDNKYVVTYETDEWYVFWRDYRHKFILEPGGTVYVFSSIFAPTDLEKSILHRWKWFDQKTDTWEIMDNIGYGIKGGRDGGYRGYTFKNNVRPGKWEIDVITEEGLVLGMINFEIIMGRDLHPKRMVQGKF